MRRLSQKYVEDYYSEYGYELMSVYKNMSAPMKMKCPYGHITETMCFGSFKKGCRCSICSRKAKLTYEFVKGEFEKEGYELISKEYINANSKLKTICPKNHIWSVTYGHFYDGKRCGECDKSKKLTYEFVKGEFEKEGYELISKEYINAQSPLTVKCSNGHTTHTITWNNFNSGQRCRICNESKGESRIFISLKNMGIVSVREKTFRDCRHKLPLHFDFYLPEHNTLIEFDGKQHFEIVDIFGGLDGFIDTKIRDTIKNEYCKNNNIKLIRIPYWDYDNIEEILNKHLIK